MAEDRNKASEPTVKKFNFKDFTDKKVLGEGSFNQVYLATHKQLGKCVIKVVCRTFHVKEKQKPKLEQEAIDMFAIKHKHIIAGYGIVMEPEHLCLVYEFADYGCLRDALRRIYIAMSLKIRIAYQVSLAIEYLHNLPELKVVHRNLKTANVLLTNDFTVKVSDFLLPKHSSWMTEATKEKEHTERKRKAAGKETPRKGTMLAHIPPETMKNINTKPQKTHDVYSYGVIIWELLTNKVPFEGYSNQEVFTLMCDGYALPDDSIPYDRPQVMFEVLKGSLNRNPEQRPTFAQISQQLRSSHETTARDALLAVADCQKAYEQYRIKKRKQMAEKSLQGRRSLLASTSSELDDNDRVFDDQTALSEKTTLPLKGQAVDRTAHVAPLDTSTYQKPEPPSEQNEIKGFAVQSTDAEIDDMEMEASKPSSSKDMMSESASQTVQEPSRYFGETLKPAPNKATPFMERPDEQIPPQGSRQLEIGDSTNISIQGQTINFQMVRQTTHHPPHTAPISDRSTPTSPPTPDPQSIPAMYSSRDMGNSDYELMCRLVGNNWKTIARKMGFPEGEIDVINHDYDRDGLKEKIYQLFRTWRERKGGSVAISDLAGILVESNLHEIARNLTP